ncbi:protein EDS1-like [Prunus yedoensis var. nudiflora]|uniref:Protein EDS1-like n=1 Tax=Prunus yedoensis var. nudiflora TaxID=2094558 RepID=A0A314XQI9_PRUYE|nr:protein EDS1-like [Prunus yedoensis var. nudiflora]
MAGALPKVANRNQWGICFWEEVEELLKQTHSAEAIYGERDRVLELQRNLGKWIKDGEVGKYVLLEQSSFVKLWNKLAAQARCCRHCPSPTDLDNLS